MHVSWVLENYLLVSDSANNPLTVSLITYLLATYLFLGSLARVGQDRVPQELVR